MVRPTSLTRISPVGVLRVALDRSSSPLVSNTSPAVFSSLQPLVYTPPLCFQLLAHPLELLPIFKFSNCNRLASANLLVACSYRTPLFSETCTLVVWLAPHCWWSRTVSSVGILALSRLLLSSHCLSCWCLGRFACWPSHTSVDRYLSQMRLDQVTSCAFRHISHTGDTLLVVTHKCDPTVRLALAVTLTPYELGDRSVVA